MLEVNSHLSKKIISQKDYTKLKIITDGEFQGFLTGSIKRQVDFIICPTGALQLPHLIDIHTCIECLLCSFITPNDFIKFKYEENSLEKFIKYCKTNPSFITQWITILLASNKSYIKVGLDIKIKGNQREKRIPILSIHDDQIVLWKIVKEYKNLEKSLTVLSDLDKIIVKDYGIIPKKIALIIESEKTNPKKNILRFMEQKASCVKCKIISLEYIWTLLNNNLEKKNINWNKILSDNSNICLLSKQM